MPLKLINLLNAFCLLLIFVLQYQYWFGANGWRVVRDLDKELQTQRFDNEHLTERNQMLQAEVIDLKTQLFAIEERARTDLGMIKHQESFVHVVSRGNACNTTASS
ncbi:MAG: cell division protein FtsB [Pseudomonadota bacterium]